MYRVSYSSSGFEDRGIEAALDAVALAGFRYVELCARAPHIPTPPTGVALARFRNRLSDRGLHLSAVHGPTARHVLGAPVGAWREESASILADHIRFAGAIGAPDLVVHPVPDPARVPDAGSPSVAGCIRDALLRSLDDLLPIAGQTDVRVLLENLPYQCDFPYLVMGELRPLVELYPKAQVGLVVDTGHAQAIGNDPTAEIRQAGSRLGGVHLQDTERDCFTDPHWVPTHGDLDWESIVRALLEADYVGAWTFEVHQGRHGESAEEAARQCLQLAGKWGL
jgi:sugar phosphate isomerase/epimerase